MIIRFPRRGVSDSLPACRRLQISHADLKGLVLKLLEEVADLRRTIACCLCQSRLIGCSPTHAVSAVDRIAAAHHRPARSSFRSATAQFRRA